jgi:hypothetical protein
MFNIFKRNIWTHETEHVGTAPDAYAADRRSMAINTDLRRQGDTDHYSYFEPVDGWEAEAKRAKAIESDWKAWRKVHGFAS